MNWQGVFPAITTPFDDDYRVDYAALSKHAEWQLAAGCQGLVALGSLGEGATLTFDEKLEILQTCVNLAKTPVVAGISALSTEEAVTLAKAAERVGCRGLMVLPQYVYRGDWRENKAHITAILKATPLPCMLYNNPVAYGIDFVPEQVAELAEASNLVAIKESSTDVRRVTAIRALIGDRLAIFMGVDDAIVEGIGAGAVGWVAGLVNAFPHESVKLFDLARAGKHNEAFELYRWFLPLLRLDTVPKFVQYIKLVQQEMGMGHERTRPPRLTIQGQERNDVLEVLRQALATRPSS